MVLDLEEPFCQKKSLSALNSNSFFSIYFNDCNNDFAPSFSSSFYNTKSVVLCLGITAIVCLCVTIFSFQSKVRRAASNGKFVLK